MVDDISSRATSGYKTPFKIDMAFHPGFGIGIGLVGLTADPVESVDGVEVGGWEAIFGSETVVDGEDESGDFGGHTST